MTTRKKPPSRFKRGWPSGITLIEVVASTALVGTLLAGVILSAGAHFRQLRSVERKLAATDQLDRFLCRWSRDDYSNRSLMRCAAECQLAVVAPPGGSEALSRDAEQSLGTLRVIARRADTLRELELEIVRVEAKVSGGAASGVDAWVEIVRRAE